jgi:hypothetical protein
MTDVDKFISVAKLAYLLCLQLEADKHRDQPELLEVVLLTTLESIEYTYDVTGDYSGTIRGCS